MKTQIIPKSFKNAACKDNGITKQKYKFEQLKDKPGDNFKIANHSCHRSDWLIGRKEGMAIFISHKIKHIHEGTFKTRNKKKRVS